MYMSRTAGVTSERTYSIMTHPVWIEIDWLIDSIGAGNDRENGIFNNCNWHSGSTEMRSAAALDWTHLILPFSKPCPCSQTNPKSEQYVICFGDKQKSNVEKKKLRRCTRLCSAIAMSVTMREMAQGSNKGMCHGRWDKGRGRGETMGVEIEVG